LAVFYAASRYAEIKGITNINAYLLISASVTLYNLALAVIASTGGIFSTGTLIVGAVASIVLFALPFFVYAQQLKSKEQGHGITYSCKVPITPYDFKALDVYREVLG